MTNVTPLQKIASTIVSMLILALISYFATHILPQLFEEKGLISYNSYEQQILSCLVKPKQIDVTLKDIGGLASIKKELQLGIMMPLQNPEVFFTGKRCLLPSKGVLFVGAPGTGKTMLAKAIAKECNVNFLCLTLATLENKYFGESSKILASAFSLARKMQPCILFFDEIDGMMKKRSNEDQGCQYSFKTEFLTQIDGMANSCKDAIVVIGATNNGTVLDDALKRRLPRVFTIGLPSPEERMEILKKSMRDEPQMPILDEDLLKKETEGFSGSDLNEVYKAAATNRLTRQLEDPNFQTQLAAKLPIAENLDKLRLDDWKIALKRIQTSKNAINVEHCIKKNNDLIDTLDKIIKTQNNKNQSS